MLFRRSIVSPALSGLLDSERIGVGYASLDVLGSKRGEPHECIELPG
jgi:hypothetical protein